MQPIKSNLSGSRNTAIPPRIKATNDTHMMLLIDIVNPQPKTRASFYAQTIAANKASALKKSKRAAQRVKRSSNKVGSK